ncbi:hypothetical protein ACEPAG_9381 [Sanghuangporus baumii]
MGHYDTESVGEFTGRILTFFAPLIIWEYKACKKSVAEVVAEIKILNARLVEQCHIIGTLRRGSTLEEVTSSYAPQHPQAPHTASSLQHEIAVGNEFGLDTLGGIHTSLKRKAEEDTVGISDGESSKSKSNRRSPAQRPGSAPEGPQIELPPAKLKLIWDLSTNVEGFGKGLAKALEERRKCTHRLNILERCLKVLTDNKLLKLAISGASRIFVLVKAGTLKVETRSDELEHAWATIKKIGTSEWAQVDSQEVLNSIEALRRMEEASDANKDETTEASRTTEKAIDTFIEEQASSLSSDEGEGSKVYTDYHILLHWLDSLNPVPMNQESGTMDPEAEVA